MAPKVDPVETDSTVPERADVVVIGGGIVGTSAALALAEKGVSVTLCEKGHIAGEQSGRNWGWCRKTGRDLREFALIRESMRLWERMNETVGAETGYRRRGIVFVSDTDERLARHEAWLKHAKEYQFDSRMLRGREIEDLLPRARDSYKAALYTPSDGCAEPTKAAPAIASAARRRGVTILTTCAVRGAETTGGRISGVVTEKGRIACDAVVLAGGAWSRHFCRHLGVDLPQLRVRATAQRTEPADAGPDPCLWTADFAVRRRLDGGCTVATSGRNVIDIAPDNFRLFRQFLPAARAEWSGLRLRVGRHFFTEWRTGRYRDTAQPSPYEEHRVLDPAPIGSIADRTKAALDRVFPAFASVSVAERWGGYIDVTPDAVPVIAPVATVPGLVLATGFSGHGFGIGPGAGRLAADLAANDTTIVDPQPFRLERFHDGSPLRLESWL